MQFLAQYNKDQSIEKLIQNAIWEDTHGFDHSALACIPSSQVGNMKLLVKEDGIIAGVELASIIFKEVDNSITVTPLILDGAEVYKGDIVFTVQGPEISLLKAERLVLNCMQRMSAIATKTKSFASLIEDLSTKILDTRKTTPGIRILEKWAVKIGGGENHRFGLYDMIMLKDNHIDFAGGIAKAIEKTKSYLSINKLDLKIEVETRNLTEVKEVIEIGGVHRIMLDNFNLEDTVVAVELIAGRYETEASGGIDENTLRNYALCGVDYVSMGALTHSVYNMDLSLKAL